MLNLNSHLISDIITNLDKKDQLPFEDAKELSAKDLKARYYNIHHYEINPPKPSDLATAGRIINLLPVYEDLSSQQKLRTTHWGPEVQMKTCTATIYAWKYESDKTNHFLRNEACGVGMVTKIYGAFMTSKKTARLPVDIPIFWREENKVAEDILDETLKSNNVAYVKGCPGSGKSKLMFHKAMRMVSQNKSVLWVNCESIVSSGFVDLLLVRPKFTQLLVKVSYERAQHIITRMNENEYLFLDSFGVNKKDFTFSKMLEEQSIACRQVRISSHGEFSKVRAEDAVMVGWKKDQFLTAITASDELYERLKDTIQDESVESDFKMASNPMNIEYKDVTDENMQLQLLKNYVISNANQQANTVPIFSAPLGTLFDVGTDNSDLRDLLFKAAAYENWIYFHNQKKEMEKQIFSEAYLSFTEDAKNLVDDCWSKFSLVMYSIAENNPDIQDLRDSKIYDDYPELYSGNIGLFLNKHSHSIPSRLVKYMEDATIAPNTKSLLTDVVKVFLNATAIDSVLTVCQEFAMRDDYKTFASQIKTYFPGAPSLTVGTKAVQEMFFCLNRKDMEHEEKYLTDCIKCIKSNMADKLKLSHLSDGTQRRLRTEYKYHYAGSSARWFFDYTVEQIISAVVSALNTLSYDIADLKSADSIPHTIRAPLSIDQDTKILNVGATSPYVEYLLTRAASMKSLTVEQYRSLASAFGNAGSQGIFYEKFLFEQIRERRIQKQILSVLYVGTYKETSKKTNPSQTLVQFPLGISDQRGDDMEDMCGLLTTPNVWAIPHSNNFPTIDAAIRINGLLFVVQVTKNQRRHGFNFNVVRQMLSTLKEKNVQITQLEVAMIVPRTKVAYNLSLDVSGGLDVGSRYNVANGLEPSGNLWPVGRGSNYDDPISMYVHSIE